MHLVACLIAGCSIAGAVALTTAPARAEILTVTCPISKDYDLRIDIDVNGSRVRSDFISRPDRIWISAEISDSEIIWMSPRYEPGDGLVAPANRSRLDRFSGRLILSPICLSRDAGWCTSTPTVLACKKAEALF